MSPRAHLAWRSTQVPLDEVVAAGCCERLLCVRARGAELLADDVVLTASLQIGPVRLGVEAGVASPQDPVQHPAPEVVLHASDDELVRGGPRKRPAADRKPFGGDGHSDHDLGQVFSELLSSTKPATAMLSDGQ